MLSTADLIQKGALIPREATVRDAIESLNRSCIKLALVIRKDLELCGVIGDGDIRRALLLGDGLESSIENIMTKMPFCIEAGRMDDQPTIERSKISNQPVPILDASKKVVGLIINDHGDIQTKRRGALLIMAGGLGTRLLPMTKNIPKPMANIAGKPLLAHIVEKARHENFTDIYISIGYLGHVIEDYFGNGNQFGVSISYLKESEPLGTAGALFQLKGEFKTPILVTNGDIITETNYADLYEYHLLSKVEVTVAVRLYETRNPFGVTVLEGDKIVDFVEKPTYKSYISGGLYVINPNVITAMADYKPIDMPDLLKTIINRRLGINAYFMHEAWTDVGTHGDLMEIRTKMDST